MPVKPPVFAPFEEARPAPPFIGQYRVLERIGEGGMGDVYLCEQVQPIRRRVAVKVLKSGMRSREIVARFKAEQQVMAIMTHPNIARVLDAGETLEGVPFFAMEFVHGTSIIEYSALRKLSLRERLALFSTICAAVHHAHQKGIIHRDLKPTNILVTEIDGQPQPKIIDFGIARAISVLPNVRFEEVASLAIAPGTPTYMSPEHADYGTSSADTRSDIYSLGVILYELICGIPPLVFDPARQTFSEMQRMVHETFPAAPSLRLRETGIDKAGYPATSNARRLSRKVSDDLDWIVLKALEKEPRRRYETALELAADIQRYLDGQPVTAARPGRFYGFRKLLQRHSAAVTFSIALGLLLIGFSVFSAWQTYRLTQERDIANLETLKANEITDFMVNLFALGDPQAGHGKDLTVREAVDIGARRLAETSKGTPNFLELQHTIAGVYIELGNYPQAETIYRDLLALPALDENEQAELYKSLARAIYYDGRYAEALPVSRDAVMRMIAVKGPDDMRTLRARNELAVTLMALDELGEAENIHLDVIRILELQGNPDPEFAALVNYALGSLYETRGELPKARPLLESAYSTFRELLGEHDKTTGWARQALAKLEIAEAHFAEAERLIRITLAEMLAVYGENHPRLVSIYNNLAVACRNQGKYQDAAFALERASTIAIAGFGEYTREAFVPLLNLAGVHALAGNLEDADGVYQRLLDISGKVFGSSSSELAATYAYYGSLRHERGDSAHAQRLIHTAIAMFNSLLPADHWRIADAKVRLARVVAATGRDTEARHLLDEAIVVLGATFGDGHPRAVEAIELRNRLTNLQTLH